MLFDIVDEPPLLTFFSMPNETECKHDLVNVQSDQFQPACGYLARTACIEKMPIII